jgi:hypothetical protein
LRALRAVRVRLESREPEGRQRRRLGSVLEALRPDGWTSADAAGLPILPGLVRYDELLVGKITHAIRFTAQTRRDGHIWPARHDAGTSGASYPPMGARFRLAASFDLTGFSAKARIVLRAMKPTG